MKPRTVDKIATGLIVFFALLIVAVLVGLLGYILMRGISHISWDFLTSAPQKIRVGGGVGPQLFNSLFLLVLTLIITVPLGLGAGIFMAEYARPGKLTGFIRLIVEVLSSFPSIVVGLFGLLLIVNYFNLGFSLVSGALALTLIESAVDGSDYGASFPYGVEATEGGWFCTWVVQVEDCNLRVVPCSAANDYYRNDPVRRTGLWRSGCPDVHCRNE